MLILPLSVIGTISISYSEKNLRENAAQNRLNQVAISLSVFERELDQMDQLAFQFSNNKNVRTVMNGNIEVERLLAKLNTMKDIALVNATNRFITEISVYFNRDNQLLLPTSYNSEAVYRLRYPGTDLFVSDISEKTKNDSNFSLWATGGNGQRSYILFTKPLPVGEQPNGLLIGLIDVQNILQLFDSVSAEEPRYLYIFHSDGTLLLSNDNDGVFADKISADHPSGSEIIHFGGDQYLATIVKSTTYDLTYIAIVPNTAMVQSVNSMRSYFFITLGVCILVGVVVALILSRQSYRPIRAMVDEMFKIGSADNSLDLSADYDSILKALSTIANRNIDMENRLEQHLPGARLNLTTGLISGRFINDPPKFDQALKNAKVKFSVGSSFVAAAVHIDNYSGFSSEDNSNDLSLIEFSIINILTELLENKGELLSMLSGSTIDLIVCLSKPAGEDFGKVLQTTLTNLQSFMFERMNIELSIGIGTAADGIANIPRSHANAQIALSQRYLRGNGTFAVYDTLGRSANCSYYYPIDRERQVINLIKNGDFDMVRLLLSELLQENLVERKLPIAVLRFFLYNIVGSVIKVFDDMGLSINHKLGERTMNIISDEHTTDETIEQLFETLLGIIKDLCDYVNETRESSNIHLKKQILEFLAQNYHDSNLSLFSIADHFSVSGSYLSRYFKDQTGINFSDYISEIRIAKAKELLADKKFSIVDVAASVGYNSANSFIRTFKRYELITPGQYREKLGNK